MARPRHDTSERAFERHEFSRRLTRLYLASPYRSCTELAEESGVKSSTMSRYLTGATWPSARSIYRLCSALGCQPADLLPDTDDAMQEAA